MKGKKVEFDDITLERMKSDYINGMTYESLVDKYGYSKSTLQRVIVKELDGETREKRSKRMKIEVEETYFDNITPKKARELAYIFKYGSVYTNKNLMVLSVADEVNRKKHLHKVVKNFADIKVSDLKYIDKFAPRYRIRINNLALGKRLEELGLKKELPIFEDEKNRWAFFDEFFKYSVSISRESFRISLAYHGKENMLKYLTEYVGVDEDEITFLNGGYYVWGKSGMAKLIKTHNDLYSKMLTYCEEKAWTKKLNDIKIILKEERVENI